MDIVEPFVALVIYSTTPDAQSRQAEWSDRESFQQFRQSDFGQAAVHLTAALHPKAYWLLHHAAVEAP